MVKTNLMLCDYCEAQVGKYYWYGCFGQISSPSLLAEKRRQYPSRYTATDFKNQFGTNVFDCAGLPKGFLMAEEKDGKVDPSQNVKYDSRYDYSANGMIAQCKEQGEYSSMPEIKGLVVWKSGHMGVYVGGGIIIEAKGHAYGVVRTPKVGGTKWQKWGKLPWIEYKTDEEGDDVKLPDLKKGDKNASVARVQLILNYLGIRDMDGKELEIDRSYGRRTAYCVEKAQKIFGLPVTGVVNAATWTALLT